MSFLELGHAHSGLDAPEKRLQPSDIRVLEQIYERKLDHMPKYMVKLLPSISDIIKGVVHVREPYTHDRNVPVEPGATYYGMLYYRGTIMRNLQHKVPLADWDLQAVIAMFCSSIDRNHSFFIFFDQTRYKLTYNSHKRLLKRLYDIDEDLVMTAYTLACMEYAKGGLDASRPTYYTKLFAKLYVANPKCFARISGHRGKVFQSKIALRVQRCKASPQWASIGEDIKANLDFIYHKGDEQINKIVDKKIRRKRGRKKSQQLANPRPARVPETGTGGTGSGFACKLSPIVYDNDRIQHHLQGNPLLQALVESTPGMRARTTPDVDDGLDDMGTFAQALELDFGNPEESDSDVDMDVDEEAQTTEPNTQEDGDFELFCQNLSFDSMIKQLEAMMLQPDCAGDPLELTPYKPPEDEELDGYGSGDMDMGDSD